MLPHGGIPLVEPSNKMHEQFVNAAAPAWVLIKMHHARQLYNKGETADSWTPDQTNVITTSTIQDVQLQHITPSDEKEIVENFNPDAHIGGEVSAYRTRPRDDRIIKIYNCMRNLLWLDRELSTDTTVIPIIKGVSLEEHEMVYRVFDYLDHNHVAFYGTQHITSEELSLYQLIEELEQINEEINTHYNGSISVLLIGLLAPFLSNAPPCVTASCGMNGWRKHIEGLSDRTRIQREWEEIEANASDWLDAE